MGIASRNVLWFIFWSFFEKSCVSPLVHSSWTSFVNSPWSPFMTSFGSFVFVKILPVVLERNSNKISWRKSRKKRYKKMWNFRFLEEFEKQLLWEFCQALFKNFPWSFSVFLQHRVREFPRKFLKKFSLESLQVFFRLLVRFFFSEVHLEVTS